MDGSSPARAAMFAPLDATGGRARCIARRLTDAMALGVLHDGERLPSEAELADTFGVALVTVREALTMLRGDGLVETTRGRYGGSFVRLPTDPAVALLPAGQLGAARMRDLLEHYGALRGSAAVLATQRADESDVEHLTRLAEAAQTPGDVSSRLQEAARFSVALGSAAHSPRLTRAMVELQPDVLPVLGIAMTDPTFGEVSNAGRRALIGAVQRRDAAAARQASDDYLRALFECARSGKGAAR